MRSNLLQIIWTGEKVDKEKENMMVTKSVKLPLRVDDDAFGWFSILAMRPEVPQHNRCFPQHNVLSCMESLLFF
jgi:hypothetical protein